MKKRMISLLSLLLLVTALLPLPTQAITPLDTSRACSMTLNYTQEGVGFADLEISVYQIAKAQPDGTFYLIAPYSSYPIRIHSITSQQEWETAATTLKAYIAADSLQPTHTKKTNASGKVVFGGLEPGLYMVMGVTAENNSGIYQFKDFLIYAPTPYPDGTYDYDVEATPKCTNYIPKTQYQVVKLWKDTGYTSSRPKEVTIDIYKDGVLQESRVLNAQNNWSYTWYVAENNDGVWTVKERTVPQNYTVTISEKGGVFTVTNTRWTSPESPPKTGDMFPFWPYVLTMCISGTLLLILGIYYKRKNK